MAAGPDLADVQAYRVETHEGRYGSVAAVLPRAGRNGSGILLVQQGPLSCRLVTVPFDAVESVDRKERRLLLREEASRRATCRVFSPV